APGVLSNDTDPDGDRLSAQLVSGPARGTLHLNPDGSFSYLPNGGPATRAYWRFEEGTGATFADSSGNGNTGDLLNSLGFATAVPSNPVPQTGAANGLSLGFDGSNDVAVVPDSRSL